MGQMPFSTTASDAETVLRNKFNSSLALKPIQTQSFSKDIFNINGGIAAIAGSILAINQIMKTKNKIENTFNQINELKNYQSE